MRIDLKTISHAPRPLAVAYPPEWWRNDPWDDGQIRGMEGPLAVTVQAFRAGGAYVVEGTLSGRLRIRCDRCTEAYAREVKTHFRVVFSPPPAGRFEQEAALEAGDLASDFVLDDQVELDDLVREQIYLTLPMKALCSENCLGLCPECGEDLNRGSCRCPKDASG